MYVRESVRCLICQHAACTGPCTDGRDWGGQPQKRKWSPTPSSPNVDPVGVADSSDNLAGPTDGNACQTGLFVRGSVLWTIHPHSFSRPSPKTESKQQSALSLVGIEPKSSMHTLHPSKSCDYGRPFDQLFIQYASTIQESEYHDACC